jgi:hypothetical protein
VEVHVDDGLFALNADGNGYRFVRVRICMKREQANERCREQQNKSSSATYPASFKLIEYCRSARRLTCRSLPNKLHEI